MEALEIEPSRVSAWTVLGMVIAQEGDQRTALGPSRLQSRRTGKATRFVRFPYGAGTLMTGAPGTI